MSKRKEIEELLSNSCKDASEMTQALKSIGDGSMKRGLKNMTDLSDGDGERRGIKKGGLIVGGIGLGLWATREIVGLIKKRKQDKKKEEEILEKLEEYEKDKIENSESTENEKEEE